LQSQPGRRRSAVIELVDRRKALAPLCQLRERLPACRREVEEPKAQPAIHRQAPIRASTLSLQARRGRVQLRDPIWLGRGDVNALAALAAESAEFDGSPRG